MYRLRCVKILAGLIKRETCQQEVILSVYFCACVNVIGENDLPVFSSQFLISVQEMIGGRDLEFSCSLAEFRLPD
jgi:hypothetical protein